MTYPIKLGGNVVISQGFGENPQFYAQFGLKGHNGLDISCPKGTPLYACADGDMSFEAGDSGYGKHVFIMFMKNGKKYQAVYGHLDSFEGGARQVKEGEVIGYADSTGISSGHHLHFGVREWNVQGIVNYNNGFLGYFDPVPFLKGNMTNAKLIQIGPTLGYWFPATTGDGLKSQALNVGQVLPEKLDGSVDFDKVTPDYKI